MTIPLMAGQPGLVQRTAGNKRRALVAVLTAGGLVGLIVGIGLAFLVDYVDPSLRSRQEAETLLQLPVLGEIPRTGRGVAA